MTKCTAIVPAYLAAATLRRTLDSLTRLNGETVEQVLVVCSDAESLAAAKEFRAVRPIACKRRLSAGSARNWGASLSDSELLLFVDADCELPRGAAARLIARLEEGDAGAVGASIANAGCGAGAGVRHLLEFKDYEPRRRRPLQWMLPSTALLCRRRVFDRAGGFPDLWPGEDLVFAYRLARLGVRVDKADQVVVRHHPPRGIASLLNHQRRLGATSAVARRLTGMSGAAVSEHAVLVPFLCAARLIRSLLWVLRCDVRRAPIWLARFPLLLLALSFWGSGFAAAARNPNGGWPGPEPLRHG